MEHFASRDTDRVIGEDGTIEFAAKVTITGLIVTPTHVPVELAPISKDARAITVTVEKEARLS
jgi:hypothetical protein